MINLFQQPIFPVEATWIVGCQMATKLGTFVIYSVRCKHVEIVPKLFNKELDGKSFFTMSLIRNFSQNS